MNNRWFQLSLGVIAMIMIANLQYGWTLFVNPLQNAHGWSKVSIQLALRSSSCSKFGWCL